MKHFFRKIKRKTVSSAVIFAILLSIIPAGILGVSAYETINFQGDSLFTDSSFESQKRGSFGFDIDSENSHTGSKSLMLETSGAKKTYKYLRSVSQLDATKNYQVGVWVKASETPVSGEIFFWANYGSGDVELGNSTITNEWTYYSYRISGLGETEKINLNMGLGVTEEIDGITVWFDDFTLIEITDPVDSGLLVNGSLEGGNVGNSSFVLDSNVSNAHTGVNSLKVVANGTAMEYGYLSADVDEGMAYEVGVWIRADKDISDKIVQFIGYYYDTSNIKHDLEPFGSFAVSDEWVFCSYRLKNLSAVDVLYIGIGITDTANEVTVWFDDFKVQQVENTAENLFEDGSFEGSGYTDKNYIQVDDVSNTGAKSLKVEANGVWKEYSYFKGANNLDASKTYLLSVYARASAPTDTDTIFFKGAFTGDIPWTDLGNCNYQKLTEEWTKFSYILELKNYEFEAETVNFSACLGVTGYVSGVTVWFDDISLVEIADIKHIDTGLYPDGDYESNVGAYMSGDWKQDRDVFYDGAASLRNVGTAVSDSFHCRDVIIDDPTATYKLTLYIKTENCPGKKDVSVNVVPQDDANSWKYGWYTGKTGDWKLISTGGTHDWTKFTYTFRGVFAEDVTKCHIYLRNDSTGTVWFDNVSFKKIENVEPTGPMTAFPEAGPISNFSKVSLAFGDADVSIMYTTDGSDPKYSDTVQLYNENNGIIITGSTTVTAFAQADGYDPSENYVFEYIAPDMVTNGDFEEGLWNNSTEAWTLSTDGTQGNIASGTSVDRNKMSSDVITIKPEYNYILTFKAKTENLSENSAGCYITLRNSLKGSAGDMVYNFNENLVVLNSGTTDWTEYSVDITDIAEEFDGLIINVFVEGGGNAYFDDFDIDVKQANIEAFEIKGYTDNLGNIYFGNPDKSTINFTLQINNQMSRTFENTTVLVETEDALTGDIIAEETFVFDYIEPKELINKPLNLSALSYYGTFVIHVYIKNDMIDLYNTFKVARVMEAYQHNDMMCVNVHIAEHFDGGVQEETMLETLDLITAAGIGCVADDFRWSDIEKEKGVIEIPENYRRFIDACYERGLKVRIGLGFKNPVYGIVDPMFPVTKEELEACANAFAIAVKEFKGKIESIEIIGEPDYWLGEWYGYDYSHPVYNPESYAEMCKYLYSKLKSANSDIKVNYGGSLRLGTQTMGFIERMFKTGLLDYTDSLAIHPYCNPGTPYGIIDSWFKDLENLASKYTDKKLTISAGEIGWSTYEGENGCTEAEQAYYIMQTYLTSVMYGNVDIISLYDISNDGPSITEIENNFGLLGSRWAEQNANETAYLIKPAYGVMSTIANKLTGIEYVQDLDIGSGIIAMKYKTAGGKDLVALWDYHGNSKKLTFSTNGTQGEITWFDIFGNENYVSDSKENFIFTLSGAPIFIEADAITSLTIVDDSEENIDDDSSDTSINNSSDNISTNNTTLNSGTNTEISDVDVDEDEDGESEYYEVVKKIMKRRKKNSDSLSTDVIIGIAAGGTILLAGICLLVILLIKRKHKKRLKTL